MGPAMSQDPLVRPAHYRDCSSIRPKRRSPLPRRPRYYIEVYRAELEFAVTCGACFRTTCYTLDAAGTPIEVDELVNARLPDWEEEQ